MTTTNRQNNLILNQDWTRIYQTFRNADFKSYDFENLRRVIITYLRENYPEDFNDYIESSEYLALIDAIAFLGQSLAFRIDLASRENFIELAETKESVLRIAQMLSYNAKRNVAAQGLLKFVSVSTTEDLVDSNGRNLANQIVSWNDPTNSNWLEQFITVLNASMSDNTEFGRSQGTATILGIPSEQYRFRTSSTDIPLFTFSKAVAARGMTFEIVSTAFKDSENYYEEPPVPGNQLGFVYRNDGAGAGSPNTGFFLMFKQGSLEIADFNIAVPTTNERIAIDAQNINNNDLWLFGIDSTGIQSTQWTPVSSLLGNNIAYNSLQKNIRNIFSVQTKENDSVDLVFSDGVYGNLPQGTFRIYYRVSNGLTYTIYPNEMKGINISVQYLNKNNVTHTLTIGLALQSTVANANASEDIDTVRTNAPASYYTQNRMITGEDYNLAPLTSSQSIIKVKAVNRTSSGISRNFDIIDASGKYSSVNVFASDGYIYKQENERSLSLKYTNTLDIINFIRQNLEPQFSNSEVYNFYLTKFDKLLFTDTNTVWQSLTTSPSTGYFKNTVDNSLLKVGSYSTSTLKYFTPDALIKFVPPAGYAFKKNKLVVANANDPDQVDRLWAKAVRISGDGTNAGRIDQTTRLGPITLSESVPNGSIAARILPKFVTDLPVSLESQLVSQITNNQDFGLRFDIIEQQWKIIENTNLNLSDDFNLGKAGDTTNANLDSSWIFAFVQRAGTYTIRIRYLSYIFGSLKQNRFYFDVNEKKYNDSIGRVVKDTVNVLNINKKSNLITQLQNDLIFEITDSIKFDDGYESNKEIKIAFKDSDDDGVIDNPEEFEILVGTDQELNYLYFELITDEYGTETLNLLDNSNDIFIAVEKQSLIDLTDTITYPDNQLIYFYDTNENVVKKVVRTTDSDGRTTSLLETQNQYRAYIGRRDLKFQYVHNASVDRRIDPSVSNIIDLYLLTRSYDESYRIYLAGGLETEPEAPTTETLRVNFGSTLSAIKSISDEIIYHPVRYKVLFGSKADEKLQASFKVVKNPNRTINDNDLKVRIVAAINEFFDINNWDFGDRFYMSEMVTYILNSVAPDCSNIVIVPRQASQVFGSLFEIQSGPDEILISGATVDDIEIVTAITAAEINASIQSVVTST